jgi:hypothetical protein
MLLGAAPLLVVGIVVFNLTSRVNREAQAGTSQLAQSDLSHVVDLLYGSVNIYNESLAAQSRQTLAVAADALRRGGGLSVDPKRTVTWENQFDERGATFTLPALWIGKTPIVQEFSESAPVPVVDDVRDLLGARCTIFQRVNPAGDMIRVATNVMVQGSRAIGTVIPAVDAKGQKNPVVTPILQGKSYVGRSFVVDGYYASAYQPITVDGQVAGMLFVGLPEREAVARLVHDMDAVKVAESGLVFVFNAVGEAAGTMVRSLSRTDDGKVMLGVKDASGRPYVEEIAKAAIALPEGAGGDAEFRLADGEGAARDYVVRFRYFKPWDWVIAVAVPKDELFATQLRITELARSSAWVLTFCFIGALALTAMVWTVLARRIVGRIRPLVAQVLAAASQVSAAATELAGSSQQLAKNASEQVASSEDATHALDSMTRMTRENADAAGQAAKLAAQGHSAAEVGMQAMTRVGGAMSSIEVSGRNVAKIAKVIDEIAFQTQLLSLNAAVEAARAGETGLGFAVVADEVRTLARRSAESAKDASVHVDDAISSTHQGNSLSRELQSSLERLVVVVRDLNQSVRTIAASSEQQRDGIVRVSDAVDKMSSLGKVNAAEAECTAAASEELLAQAETLKGVSTDLVALVEGQSAG